MEQIKIIIEGNEKNIDIPKNWEELTLDNYMLLSRINKMNFELELQRDMEVIGAFLGLDYGDIELLDVETFNDIVDCLEFLKEQPKDLDSKGLKDYVEIDGEKWWIKKDFEKLTMGEKISLDTIIQNGGGDYEQSLDKILTLFLKKKLDNGELESYRTEHMRRADIFKKVKFLDIRNIPIFFSDGRNGLKVDMRESLEKQRKKVQKNIKKK
jgi:hypothetical protein